MMITLDLDFITHSLNFAAIGGAELLEQGEQQALVIAGNWDQLWKDVINPLSGLYLAMTRIGVLFAVASLMLWGIHIVKDYVDHQSTQFLHELIWPLIVILFLAKGGVMLSIVTLDVRGYINQVNQTILSTASARIDLQEAFQKAKNHGAARAEIGSLIVQCQALTGDKQIECLEEASVQSEAILDTYNLEGSGITNLLNRIRTAIAEGRTRTSEITGSESQSIGTSFFGALTGAFITAQARASLISWQVAFQQLLECSLLLTALIGPLAMGLSLLPVSSKAVYAWLTAMFSVGMAKLYFNIIAGLAATTIVSADAGDPMWFLQFVAIQAPILSATLAAGGGMAVWSALTAQGAAVAKGLAGGVSTLASRKFA